MIRPWTHPEWLVVGPALGVRVAGMYALVLAETDDGAAVTAHSGGLVRRVVHVVALAARPPDVSGEVDAHPLGAPTDEV